MTRNIKKARTAMCFVVIIAAMAAWPWMGRSAFAAGAPSMTANISVTYTVKGDPQAAGPASFILRAKDGHTPMPEGAEGGEKEITMREPGTMSFGEITYAVPDVYHYEVVRSNEPDHVAEMDGSAFEVEIAALGNGQTGQIIRKEGEQAKAELLYVDSVGEVQTTGERQAEASAAEPSPAAFGASKAKTGDSRAPVIAGMIFGMFGVLLLALLTGKRRRGLR